MNDQLIEQIISKIAPEAVPSRQEVEAGYPPRNCEPGQLITRIAPSPTGFVHIGTIYAAMINERLAHQSGGVFFLRIEDTDKKREIEGGKETIISAFKTFGLRLDEGPEQNGRYGPYIQSHREPLYIAYAIDLLRRGRAYPCFATSQEIEASIKQQQAEKKRPGYYGEHALWRDRPTVDIEAALQAGAPFVLRFRSEGIHEQRVKFVDALKGAMELPQNDLDVPLLKSEGLPTYHLAHVVDDHLMGTSLVVRGDEWLPSTPLHIELAQALEITPFNYAHIAPISITENGSKRKLSKRKDPEADVNHWLSEGYPVEAIKDYLLRLANSNFEDWRRDHPFDNSDLFELSLKKLAMSRAPLLDLKKMDDVSRDMIANMDQDVFESELFAWVATNDFELSQLFNNDTEYTKKVLTIEREGANKRKDLSKWSEAAEMYSYFFDGYYETKAQQQIQTELASVNFVDLKLTLDAFLETYDHADDQETWLQKFREAAKRAGYAPDMKLFKANPAQYKGSLADFAKIIRVRLTGKNRTPDLFLIMQIMGPERVKKRLAS